MIHARDIPLPRRVVAYLTIFVGYFFYCYNFVVLDYVRPYLVEDYGLTLKETALFYSALSLGAISGAIAVAWIASNVGKKKTLIVITLINGLGTIVNMMFTDFWGWMIMRFVIGISLGGYMVAAVSTMVCLFPQKYCARLQAVNACTFSVAVIALGALGALLGDARWETLLWIGGIPPLVAAALMMFFVPDDTKIISFGEDESADAGSRRRRGSWVEMFSGGYARFTIICAVIAGLNFMGYQFFSGFVTTYLREIREFGAESMGMLVSAQGLGSFIGGLSWGFIADRLGRRFNAIGFVFTALFICLYFIAPSSVLILGGLGFAYGFALACTYSWGVYFAEIFPPHLRPMGASLFHAGRVFSLFAPVITAQIAEHYSLITGMALAPVAFLLAAGLWYLLPETLPQSRFYRGYRPLAARA